MAAAGAHAIEEPGFALRRGWILEVALVGVLALAVFVVHDLPLITSATPIGFTFLIHWVPGDGEQRYRLVTLLFSAGAVVVAYLLGRDLRLTRVTTGLLLATGVLLTRSMLIRTDLKQYTAEAFMTLVLLLLLARLETRWTRPRLVALGAVGTLGMLLAHTDAFTATAVALSLLIVTLARREWGRLRELVVVAAAMFVGMGAVFLVFDRRHQIPLVTEYWRGWYVPVGKGPSAVWSYLQDRLPDLSALAGTRNAWVIVLLACGGIATLVWLKRPALALAVNAASPSLRTHAQQSLFAENVRAQVRYLMRKGRASDIDASLARAQRALGGRGGKIWIVRSHIGFTRESANWERELAGKGVRRIKVGPEDLLLDRVPGSAP